MSTSIRVDDISVPSDALSFAGDLKAALGPDYVVEITLQESEWLPHAVEHIKVFIQTPLGVGKATDKLQMPMMMLHQIFRNFHQLNPATDQIATFTKLTTKPICHHFFRDTYSCAKNIGDGVVP
jgi:hypothetical protein